MIDASIEEEFKGCEDCIPTLPPSWKMKYDPLTEDIGDVIPSAVLAEKDKIDNCTGSDLLQYRGISRANKNFFYLNEREENPLIEIDVRAWYFDAVIMGDITLPSNAKMVQEICSILDRAMNIPVRRWKIDPAYVLRINSLEEEDEDHWFLVMMLMTPNTFHR